jgi:hypothetical protein
MGLTHFPKRTRPIQRHPGTAAGYRTGFHKLVELYFWIAAATFAVSALKSLWNSMSSWLMMNVITPVSRYFTGVAMTANPPVIFPRW